MEISLNDLQLLLTSSNINVVPFPIGTPVYVRSCIYSATGRIKGINGKWLELSEASYIATDGRYSKATSIGVQNVDHSEIEPVGGDGILHMNIDTISDVCKHPEPLPCEVK